MRENSNFLGQEVKIRKGRTIFVTPACADVIN